MKILVLGAGRVGGPIARDLTTVPEFEVTVADRREEALRAVAGTPGLRTITSDAGDLAAVGRLSAAHDLVVGALPATMGYAALEAVIDARRPVVDISFFAEDPFGLDALARRRGVPAVVDAGVSPGLSNLIFGWEELLGGGIRRFVIYVGGLPEVRTGVFEYKAPFSPADVIELYTRPARFRAAGAERTLPALAERCELDFAGVGRLEAFLTDGLRTLLRKTEVADSREMTLRYPGHAAKVAVLRDIGLFDSGEIDVDGVRVAPRALTARLLFPMWSFEPGEPDLTALRVEVDVERGGRRERRTYDLIDRYDRATGTSSMARTTGYTCTGLVRVLAAGMWHTPGVAPPEMIGAAPGCFDFVRRHLEERRVRLTESVGSPLPAE